MGSAVRFRIFSVRGMFAKPIKKKLGFNRVRYRCHTCGFAEDYELPAK